MLSSHLLYVVWTRLENKPDISYVHISCGPFRRQLWIFFILRVYNLNNGYVVSIRVYDVSPKTFMPEY